MANRHARVQAAAGHSKPWEQAWFQGFNVFGENFFFENDTEAILNMCFCYKHMPVGMALLCTNVRIGISAKAGTSRDHMSLGPLHHYCMPCTQHKVKAQ